MAPGRKGSSKRGRQTKPKAVEDAVELEEVLPQRVTRSRGNTVQNDEGAAVGAATATEASPEQNAPPPPAIQGTFRTPDEGDLRMPIPCHKIKLDIRDPRADKVFQSSMNSMIPLVVTNPNRNLNDIGFFSKTLVQPPWSNNGDLAFYCKRGKLVRCHSVLLQGLVPKFVEDLQDFHKATTPTCDGVHSVNSVCSRISVFLTGIDASIVQKFLSLVNAGMLSVTGGQASALKSFLEVMGINEIQVHLDLISTPQLLKIMSPNQDSKVSMTNPSVATAPETMDQSQATASVATDNQITAGPSRPSRPQTLPQSSTNRFSLPIQVTPVARTSDNNLGASVNSGSRKKLENSAHTPVLTSGQPVNAKGNANRLKVADDEEEKLGRGKRRHLDSEKSLDAPVVPEVKTKRAKYSKELRTAVIKALNDGDAVGEVAQKFKIPSAVVSRWRCAENKRKKSGLFLPKGPTDGDQNQASDETSSQAGYDSQDELMDIPEDAEQPMDMESLRKAFLETKKANLQQKPLVREVTQPTTLANAGIPGTSAFAVVPQKHGLNSQNFGDYSSVNSANLPRPFYQEQLIQQQIGQSDEQQTLGLNASDHQKQVQADHEAFIASIMAAQENRGNDVPSKETDSQDNDLSFD